MKGMPMKIEKLAAFAEIVSSIAVVVTLAYLAVQTHQMTIQTQQTNSAILASSRQATMMADVTLLISSNDYPGLFNIPTAEQTEDQQYQLNNYVAAFLRIREYAWFQYQNGVMDEPVWESYIASAVNMLSKANIRPIWDSFANELDPGFVKAINQRLPVIKK